MGTEQIRVWSVYVKNTTAYQRSFPLGVLRL